jgi:hypothetical protein
MSRGQRNPVDEEVLTSDPNRRSSDANERLVRIDTELHGDGLDAPVRDSQVCSLGILEAWNADGGHACVDRMWLHHHLLSTFGLGFG